VFRINLGIGREALRERFADGHGADHHPPALDRLFPHPACASHVRVGVLNPDTTSDEVRALILAAHARARD
jgi:Family of unknown function (DUF6194)